MMEFDLFVIQHKDDEIVFRGRRASRIPIIIVTDCSFVRGEFDKMSDDPIMDDGESDVSMDEQSEKDSCLSCPTSIYSLAASSDGGVPVSSSTVRSDSLSASYRHLVSPMNSSKASTIGNPVFNVPLLLSRLGLTLLWLF